MDWKQAGLLTGLAFIVGAVLLLLLLLQQQLGW
jgi:hypothetical protein